MIIENTNEKSLRVLVVNMYNKKFEQVDLPMTKDELTSFLKEFNPDDNECEIQGIDVLADSNEEITAKHKNSIANSVLCNCNLEIVNNVATILQEDADFAFILHACDSYAHAFEVYTNETFTIFRDVPDKTSFGEEFAEHMNLFEDVTNSIIREHFDFASFCDSLYNNEVMKDVANDIVVHLHKTH
ncbi:hypothetical protein CN918_25430 [Priestia megaterium]|nr:hypothetical protein CN918_25430 [Priestia megaterium]